MPLTTEEQLAILLALPSDKETVEYFDKITAATAPGLKVLADAGSNKGKGVFAAQDFLEGDVVLIEPPLVGIQHSQNKAVALVCDHCCKWVGSVEQQVAWRIRMQHSEGATDTSHLEVAERLERRQFKLPHSEQVPLPQSVSCRGGCTSLYCSEQCANEAWSTYHQLLCMGADAHRAHGMPGSSSCSHNTQDDLSRDVSALCDFHHHSESTNDTFRLVARVVAYVSLRAHRKLQEMEACGVDAQWQALQYGWHPFKFAHKGVWWECIGVPEDAQEEEFREELRELSRESLELLRAALYDPQFPALFTLEMFGNIVGMFELNNLGIYVGSPLQEYICIVEDLPDHERAAAMEALGPVFLALGEDLDEGCEGTALYSLQSCVNHSCEPNTAAMKRVDDKDAAAVLLAQRNISKGEEITISYINENAPLADRREALMDYGFTCTCRLCKEEDRMEM